MKVLSVDDFINQQPFASFQFRIAVICFLIMLVDGFDAQAIGYVAPAIIRDLHIARAALGPIFTAGVVGMTLGSLSLGMLADRFGRKKMLVICLVIFGICTVFKANAGSAVGLVAWQFIAGLGLGGAFPIGVSLMSEYSPAPRRALITAATSSGFLVGAAVGGFVSAALIPAYGWRSVFLLGGGIAGIIALVVAIALPESLKWILLNAGSTRGAQKIVQKIAPNVDVEHTKIVAEAERASAASVRDLFAAGRGPTTVLVWMAAFMSLLVAYFVFTWLPTLFSSAGLPIQQSVIASTMIPTGALVGSIVWGWLVDRAAPPLVLANAFGIYAVCLALVAFYGSSYDSLVILLFAAGVGSAGQAGANAYVAIIYPTPIRSTAVGWMLGVGRVGAILGPLLGTVIVGWSLQTVFTTIAIPAAIAALSLLSLQFFRGRSTTATLV